MMTVTYYGHSCLSFAGKDSLLLVDPYLRDNPQVETFPEHLAPTMIFVTHGHWDHLGDAVEISKAHQAPIVTTPEVADYCAQQGASTLPMNLGGRMQTDFGSVKMVPAWHTSSVGKTDRVSRGMASGFVIHLDGFVIYHAGDTALFGDMALIGEEAPIDLACLPIGDRFTMGVEDAAKAVRLLGARRVVPIHYNTWPMIAQDPKQFKDAVGDVAECVIMPPGSTFDLR